MRKTILCIFSLIIIMALIGCDRGITDYKDIDDIIFAKVLAVDKLSTDSDNVRITIAYQTSKSDEQSNSASDKRQSAEITSEGKTIFEAVRNFDSFSNKKIFLGQVDFVLFSEDVAKDGLLKYMDFFARYEDVNLNMDTFIVKGTTAKNLLDTASKSDYFVSEYLKAMIKNSKYLSISSEVKLKDIVRTLDKDYISAYLPSLRLKESLNIDRGKDVEMDGYAIFNGEKLAGYLNGKEARGFNWITDKVISGVILVKGRDGKDISLEIHSSETKILPVFYNNNLSVTIYVDMSSNISEQTSPEDIYNEQMLEYLKKQQEQIIEQEIEQTLILAKEMHADAFGIGDSVYHKHPVKWQILKNNWIDTFAKQVINVKVTSEIKRTYIIKQPTRSEIDKNK